MQIHQLRYVLAVAENKSFSAAAKKLFLAQPSLSQQIINLEKELGIALFVRHPKSVTLTDAGEQFLKSARRIGPDAEAQPASEWNAPHRAFMGSQLSESFSYTYGLSPHLSWHLLFADRRRQQYAAADAGFPLYQRGVCNQFRGCAPA